MREKQRDDVGRKTCEFYAMLSKRSEEAKKQPENLVPLEDAV